jgi:hypothetical protein
MKRSLTNVIAFYNVEFVELTANRWDRSTWVVISSFRHHLQLTAFATHHHAILTIEYNSKWRLTVFTGMNLIQFNFAFAFDLYRGAASSSDGLV